MKSMIVLFSLAVSGLAYALVGSWTGTLFTFNPAAVEHAVNDLAAQKDSAYQAALKYDPDLRGSLKAQFQKGFDYSTNGFLQPTLYTETDYAVAPGGTPTDPRKAQEQGYYNLTPTELIFWKSYDPHGGPLFAEALWSLIPKSIRAHQEQNSEVYPEMTYKYCELHPEGDYCENQARKVYIGVALIRRIVSNPIFVKEVCSSFAAVLKRHVDWTNEHFSTEKLGLVVNLDAHFDFIDQTLAALEVGDWNVNRRDPKASRWQEFLFRRYLDGGPQLMTASRECLQNVRQALKGPASLPVIAPDPVSSGYFQTMMKFEKKAYPSNPHNFLDLSTQALGFENAARIFRQISPNVPMPKIDGDRYYEYESRVEIGKMMGRLDPLYDYRLVTAEEYDAFLPNAFTCVANKDYLNFGYEGLEVKSRGERSSKEDYGNGCDYAHLTLVRVRKSNNNGFVSAGTCYSDSSCSSVLMRDVSTGQCSRGGGHSWSSGGRCERL